jgi:cell wall assembly regulator SMI1
MKIYASLAEISDEELASLESDIGLTLPASYREFLKKHNGGRVTPYTFRYYDNGMEIFGHISRFLGVANDTEIDSVLRVWKVWQEYLPKSILPIAKDGHGNLLCISLADADMGTIYFMDHEVPENNEENLFVVADDFSSFLENLFMEDI